MSNQRYSNSEKLYPFNQDILPDFDNTHSLGTSNRRWIDLHSVNLNSNLLQTNNSQSNKHEIDELILDINNKDIRLRRDSANHAILDNNAGGDARLELERLIVHYIEFDPGDVFGYNQITNGYYWNIGGSTRMLLTSNQLETRNDIVPIDNFTQELGSSTNSWKQLYLSNRSSNPSAIINNHTISASQSAVLGYNVSADLGNLNVAIGHEAMQNSTSSAIDNICIGWWAGRDLSTGEQNVLIGSATGNNSNPTRSTFVGSEIQTSGTERIGLGFNAIPGVDYSGQIGNNTVSPGNSGFLKYRTQVISEEAWIDGNSHLAAIDGDGNIIKSTADSDFTSGTLTGTWSASGSTNTASGTINYKRQMGVMFVTVSDFGFNLDGGNVTILSFSESMPSGLRPAFGAAIQCRIFSTNGDGKIGEVYFRSDALGGTISLSVVDVNDPFTTGVNVGIADFPASGSYML